MGVLTGLLLGKGLPAGTSMSRTIGVVRTGAEVVGTSDIWAVVAFAASISVHLAVVNSLPLPALDGEQLAFVLDEAAAGRRIDQRVQEGINAGALIILLFLVRYSSRRCDINFQMSQDIVRWLKCCLLECDVLLTLYSSF
jgi:membrane-associated protease RseP (regulator of RpoE activity)